MTRLLISVRSTAEALIAYQNGADMIDVKEPTAGAMGRATAAVLGDVRATVPRARLSMAAGELLDPTIHEFDWNASHGFEFVKAAPAGLQTKDAWQSAWHRWADRLASCEPSYLSNRRTVAVAYVDNEAASALDPLQLISVALDLGVTQFLLDTFVKDGTNLFHHFRPEKILQFVKAVHSSGGWVCLAGSLTLPDIAKAVSSGADLVAFRGAACDCGRESNISANRIADLSAELKRCLCAREMSDATCATPSP